MVNETVTLFIPLLLAVVTTLSSFLRNNVNLVSVAQEEQTSFPFLLKFLPPLGRFPIIHLSNISLLLLGILIIKDVATSSLATNIGSIVLAIFSLILPILEINAYEQILDKKDSEWSHPESYYYHCFSMIFLSLYFFGFVELQAIILNLLLSAGLNISGTFVWTINRILEIVSFWSPLIGLLLLYLSMVALSNELKQVDPQSVN
jgi:hypothetical protein